MGARFLTEAHRVAYKNVARLMISLFGDNCEASMERSEFSVDVGTARIDVLVSAWRDDALVTVRSIVVRRPRLDFDLMEFLLHENTTFDMGAFGITRAGDVEFKHALLGTNCSEDDLRLSVWSVMHVADQYDDRIKQRWGGFRAIDKSDTVKVADGHLGAGSLEDETVQFSADDVTRRGN